MHSFPNLLIDPTTVVICPDLECEEAKRLDGVRVGVLKKMPDRQPCKILNYLELTPYMM